MDRRSSVGVFIADDHPVYREVLERQISQQPELELVGSADDGTAAIEGILDLKPDVALLDIRMPDLDGVGALATLREAGVETPVLFLSAHAEAGIVHAAVEAGAAGFLLKDASKDEIVRAVLRVARGGSVLSETLQAELFGEIRHRPSDPRTLLSERERQILALVAQGRSNPQIADQLYLSPATVKTYLHRACEKLEVSDRAAAVATAMRLGLLD
jgi:two-component system, NarL family, nitrate/nitrite response regulator NarL